MQFDGDGFSIKFNFTCECNSIPLVMVRMVFPDYTNKEFLVDVCKDMLTRITHKTPSKNFLIYSPMVMPDGIMFSTADKLIIPVVAKILLRISSYKDVSIKQLHRVDVNLFGLIGRFQRKLLDKTSKLYEKADNLLKGVTPVDKPKYELSKPCQTFEMTLKDVPDDGLFGYINVCLSNLGCVMLTASKNNIKYRSCHEVTPEAIKSIIKEVAADLSKACKSDCEECYFKFVTGRKIPEEKVTKIKF